MAVEFGNRLDELANKLAEEFRQTDKPNLGHFIDLSADAQKKYRDQAYVAIAIALGMPGVFLSQPNTWARLKNTPLHVVCLKAAQQFRDYLKDTLRTHLDEP